MKANYNTAKADSNLNSNRLNQWVVQANMDKRTVANILAAYRKRLEKSFVSDLDSFFDKWQQIFEVLIARKDEPLGFLSSHNEKEQVFGADLSGLGFSFVVGIQVAGLDIAFRNAQISKRSADFFNNYSVCFDRTLLSQKLSPIASEKPVYLLPFHTTQYDVLIADGNHRLCYSLQNGRSISVAEFGILDTLFSIMGKWGQAWYLFLQTDWYIRAEADATPNPIPAHQLNDAMIEYILSLPKIPNL